MSNFVTLWVKGKGWEKFFLSNNNELEKRNIFIGENAQIGNDVKLHNGVSISDESIIGDNVLIGIGTCIHINSVIGNNCIIGNWVTIGAYTKIGNHTKFENKVSIDNNSVIGNNVVIEYTSIIGAEAKIEDNTNPTTIHINGSRHPVSYWGEDRIDIGCKRHSIPVWLKYYENIGNIEGYTEEEKREYFQYIKMIAAIHDISELKKGKG